MFVLRKGTTDAGIVRANLDGSNPELILPVPQLYIFDLAIDPQNEKIYFYDFGVDQLQRANFDGTGREPVWNGPTQQFAIDPGTPQRGFVENDTYTIRSFLFATPTTVPTIITPAAVSSFAVDPIHQHIYWADHSFMLENGIMRANYDGTNPTGVALSNIYYPASMAVDPVNKRLYYNSGDGTHRTELDGDDDQVVVTPSGQNAGPSDLALDLAGGKIYISEEGADMVRRANLDGSNVEPLLSGAVVEGAEAIVIYVCAP
jgi:DNA-binding beta-propeller fold protein YncE